MQPHVKVYAVYILDKVVQSKGPLQPSSPAPMEWPVVLPSKAISLQDAPSSPACAYGSFTRATRHTYNTITHLALPTLP